MTTAFSVSVWTNPRNTLSPCIVTPSATTISSSAKRFPSRTSATRS